MKNHLYGSILLSAVVAFACSAAPQRQSETAKSSESSARQQGGKPATTPQQQERRRSMREIVMTPVVYKVPGMDQVKVQSDSKYTMWTIPT